MTDEKATINKLLDELKPVFDSIPQMPISLEIPKELGNGSVVLTHHPIMFVQAIQELPVLVTAQGVPYTSVGILFAGLFNLKKEYGETHVRVTEIGNTDSDPNTWITTVGARSRGLFWSITTDVEKTE